VQTVRSASLTGMRSPAVVLSLRRFAAAVEQPVLLWSDNTHQRGCPLRCMQYEAMEPDAHSIAGTFSVVVTICICMFVKLARVNWS
jgi:hypothetical protein